MSLYCPWETVTCNSCGKDITSATRVACMECDNFDLCLECFSQAFRSDSTLIIQAHPFRDRMTEMPAELLDGVEVFNLHPGQNSRVGFAAKYAKEHHLLVTCGTDFHHEGHQGMTALLTATEMKDSHDIVKVLKSRDYLIEIGGCIVLPYGKAQ